jgi:hypothetical protein
MLEYGQEAARSQDFPRRGLPCSAQVRQRVRNLSSPRSGVVLVKMRTRGHREHSGDMISAGAISGPAVFAVWMQMRLLTGQRQLEAQGERMLVYAGLVWVHPVPGQKLVYQGDRKMARDAQPKIPVAASRIVYVRIAAPIKHLAIDQDRRRTERISPQKQVERIRGSKIANAFIGRLKCNTRERLSLWPYRLISGKYSSQIWMRPQCLHLFLEFLWQPEIVLVKKSDPVIMRFLDGASPGSPTHGSVVFLVEVSDLGSERLAYRPRVIGGSVVNDDYFRWRKALPQDAFDCLAQVFALVESGNCYTYLHA